jgi:hypothetical protein
MYQEVHAICLKPIAIQMQFLKSFCYFSPENVLVSKLLFHRNILKILYQVHESKTISEDFSPISGRPTLQFPSFTANSGKSSNLPVTSYT